MQSSAVMGAGGPAEVAKMHSDAPVAGCFELPDPMVGTDPPPLDQQAASSADVCERIMVSIAALSSSLELKVSELVQCKAASVDQDRVLSVFEKLVPLQKRLQRMHSKLLEFGRRLPMPPDMSRRDVSALWQQLSAATMADIPVVEDPMFDEQAPTPCPRVAILTFGRWTRKCTEVLQRAGLIKDRGQSGCHYVVNLPAFQKEFLERVQQPCLYHVIAAESSISNVVTVIGALSCAERGRIKKQELVDLPIAEDEETREHSEMSASPAGPAAHVPGEFVQNADASWWHRGGVVGIEPNAEADVDQSTSTQLGLASSSNASVEQNASKEVGQSAQARYEGGGDSTNGGNEWTVIGYESF